MTETIRQLVTTDADFQTQLNALLAWESVSDTAVNDTVQQIIEAIREAGGDSFRHCYQCGKCDVVCPWNRVRDFSIRKIIREATFGLTEIESEDIWRCTTCGRCPDRCPRGVKQIEVGVSLRRVASDNLQSLFASSSAIKS